jgi:hypothetical protein
MAKGLRPSRPKFEEINSFDPVLFSIEENKFLLEALGKKSIVALREISSKAVNPKAIKPVLDRVIELETLKEVDGQQWCGVEPIKESIRAYLSENEKWAREKARFKNNRNVPRYPSLYSYDQKGRPHLGGVGSDSGRVRTYFDARGNRVPFEVRFFAVDEGTWAAPGFTEQATSGGLFVDDANNRIECKVCGHTESFRGESRASYAAARARISKHLRGAKKDVDRHREVHQEEFS